MKFSNHKLHNIFWPIAISIFISNLVGFIDSAMVANYSTISMNAISIAEQIRSIFGPMYFGILSGIAIYTAQAVGKKDNLMIKQTFGFGLSLILVISSIHFLSILFGSEYIISFFVDSSSSVGQQALSYMRVTLINTIFWPISMLFMYQFRSVQMPRVPLVINTLMLLTNSLLNLLLIYGVGFFPELGVTGAGLATAISVIFYVFVYIAYGIKVKAPFFGKFKTIFSFDRQFAITIFKSTYPLIIIELLFGLSRVVYSKLYLMTGIENYTLVTVATNITNLVNAGIIACASTAGILIGEALGRGDDVKPLLRELFKFMRFIACFLFLMIAIILPLLIPFYAPNDIQIDNFTLIVYILMLINGVYMVIRIFSSTFISILKSGGDTKVVILADPLSSFILGIPLTFIGIYFWDLPIIPLKILWLSEIVGKLLISYSLFKQGKWEKKL